MKERLQKVLAHAGVASRRVCEQMTIDGKVMVNGRVITQLGSKVDPQHDIIKVNGKIVKLKEEKVYYILNKPRGYLSSVSDDRGRKTVIDLMGSVTERIYPVGRLDYNSEGLLILTNDGTLANRIMHPRYQMRKFYLVEIDGFFDQNALDEMRSGVKLADGVTSKAYVEVLQSAPTKSLIKIGIHEGKNRQIRRMCQALGFSVKRLIRTQIGPIKLGSLPKGAYRPLTIEEIGKLKQAVKRVGKK